MSTRNESNVGSSEDRQRETKGRDFYPVFIVILCYIWKYCDSALHFRGESTRKILMIEKAFSVKF